MCGNRMFSFCVQKSGLFSPLHGKSPGQVFKNAFDGKDLFYLENIFSGKNQSLLNFTQAAVFQGFHDAKFSGALL